MPRAFRQLTAPANASKSLRDLVVDLNRVNAEIAAELARVQGLDGRTPTFNKSLDLQGYKITNVGVGELDTDGTNIGDLVKRGLFRRATDAAHVADAPIIANAGVTVPQAIHDDQAPQLAQINDAIAGATADLVHDAPNDGVTYGRKSHAWSKVESVPIGGIICWSGTLASCPTDFAVCNGVANFPGPDLTAEFIV